MSTLLPAWLARRSASTAPANPAPTIRTSNPRMLTAPSRPNGSRDQRLHLGPGTVPGGLGQMLVHGAQPYSAGLVVPRMLGEGRFHRRDEAVRTTGDPDQAALAVRPDHVVDRRRDD